MNTLPLDYRISNINLFSEKSLFEAAKYLPETLQTKINKRQISQDKAISIRAWLLLKEMLRGYGFKSDDILDKVKFNAFGKPYIENTDCADTPLEINFNYSHSCSKVLCAVSRSHNIGVDIEKIKAFDNSTLITYFTMPEVNFILQEKIPQKAFLSIWTKKEALVKCIGVGLTQINLASIEVLESSIVYKEIPYRFYTLDAGQDYVAHACIESFNKN